MNRALVLPDSDLTADEASFAQRIRAFAARSLAPHARRIDEEGGFRRESVRELAGAGILAGPLPKEHGGGGWSPLELAVAHEEIGAVCNNTRGFLAVQSGLVATTLSSLGDAAQREAWLPRLCDGSAIGCFALTEEEAGSDIGALACRAERTRGGFRIRGKKIWITNGGVADVALVFANLDPERGRDGITAFVVETDRPGLRRERMPGRELGHRGSDHSALVLDGVEVPAHAVLGGEGRGFSTALAGLHAGRLSVAAGAVGIHRAALAASIAFTAQRQQFGRPIAKFQMVQERLADMTAELLAARALVHRCARRRARGVEDPGDLAAAKLFATEAAARAADQAVMLHGGRGYSSEYPVERLLRDAMGLRIYEGTTLIQKGLLARAVLSGADDAPRGE
jgi:alkylation response protein AidB-like acyl-CoA dehydrogenase